jgi:hypothetical protein
MGSRMSVNTWDDEGPWSIAHEPSRYSNSEIYKDIPTIRTVQSEARLALAYTRTLQILNHPLEII